MAKDYQRLWEDVTNANGEAQAVRTLAKILTDKEGRGFISSLERRDAGLCIEILDRGIAKHNLEVSEKQDFFVTLRRLAACYERLPESMIIADQIEVEDQILASGGYSDVRRGNYKGHLVAVRALRVTAQDNILEIRKQFCREVVLWNTLSHPNVLKLAGIQWGIRAGKFVTVSEWMKHGNIMEYIKHNHVNRLGLLHGAAQGLEYLHGANLIHGDLKGANILMSNDTPPRACLADFGFMTMVLDPDHPFSCSAQLEGGTLMFMSPELLAPQKFGMKTAIPTPQSDVYALGLVIFQVLTGEIPFPGCGPVGCIFSVVTDGQRPIKPDNASAIGFSDQLWVFVERCWDANMRLRPEVAEVVMQLSSAIAGWNGVMPPHVKVKCVAENPTAESDSRKYRGVFRESSGTAPENTTNSGVIFSSFTHEDPPSTQFTCPPQEPQIVAPEIKLWIPTGPNEELRYPHLGKNYGSPLSLLPKKKWTSFKYLKRKFRKLFGL